MEKQKPISMMIQETKQSLAEVINKSNLHPSIIELIVKDMYVEICQLNIANTAREKEQYLKESEEPTKE